MSRTLKILLLDKYPDHLPDLSDRGIILQVTHERDWHKDVYKAPGTVLAKIREMTSVENFDIVVVGNNLGAGMLKVAAIHPRLISRTVAVWNDNSFGYRTEYEKMGVRHCMTRLSLRDYIVNLVTN